MDLVKWLLNFLEINPKASLKDIKDAFELLKSEVSFKDFIFSEKVRHILAQYGLS